MVKPNTQQALITHDIQLVWLVEYHIMTCFCLLFQQMFLCVLTCSILPPGRRWGPEGDWTKGSMAFASGALDSAPYRRQYDMI